MTHPLDLSAYDPRQPDMFRAVRTGTPFGRPSPESEQIAYWKSRGVSPREALESMGEIASATDGWGEVFIALARHAEPCPAARTRSVRGAVPGGAGRPEVLPVNSRRAPLSQSRGAALFSGATP
jgi:hypothetical protein